MTAQVKWPHIYNWCRNGQQPTDYKIVRKVHTELLHDGRDQTQQACLEHFQGIDWTESFLQILVIYYDERLTVEVLECLQQYLRQQCLDITNITVVTTHSLDVDQYWRRRCELYREKTFDIVPWLHARSYDWGFFYPTSLPDIRGERKVEHFFAWYSGAHPQLERCYNTLKILQLEPYGVIDIFADFTYSRHALENHAEYLSYFQDQQERELITQQYDHWVHNAQLRVSNRAHQVDRPREIRNPIDFDDFHWNIDKNCFALVCRETDESQPFSIVTEKTLRGFLHHMAVVPMGFKSVERLEDLGFWFPHEVIDYSYQQESDLLKRQNLMIDSLRASAQGWAPAELEDYWQHNYQRFRDNAQLCVDYRR